MFNITKNDLTRKTDRQLATLFQEAAKNVVPASPEYQSKQFLLAMIRAEFARRRLRP